HQQRRHHLGEAGRRQAFFGGVLPDDVIADLDHVGARDIVVGVERVDVDRQRARRRGVGGFCLGFFRRGLLFVGGDGLAGRGFLLGGRFAFGAAAGRFFRRRLLGRGRLRGRCRRGTGIGRRGGRRFGSVGGAGERGRRQRQCGAQQPGGKRTALDEKGHGEPAMVRRAAVFSASLSPLP